MACTRFAAGILLALVLLPGDRARAGPHEDAPRGAALLARITASGEAAAFRELLASDEDPWLAAEDLLLLGRPDVAGRLATAARAADDGALERYLEAAPAPAPDLAARVARATDLLAADKPAEALAALGEPDTAAPSVTVVRTLGVRARVLMALDRPEEASAALDRLTSRAAAIGWRRAETEAQRALLERLDATADHETARRILSRLLALDRDARDLARSASWCARLGTLEAALGNARLGRTWLLEAASLFGVMAQSPGLTPPQQKENAATLTTLASVHVRLGNVAAGMQVAFRAHDAAEALDVDARIDAARALGEGFHVLSRLDEAEAQLREAEALARDGPPFRHHRILGDLARLRLEQGDSEEAKALYDRVLAADEIRNDPRTSFVARLHVAGAWIDRPTSERTVASLQRALVDLLDVLRDLERAPPEFTARSEIAANAKAYAGRALNLLGRHAESVPLLRQVLEEGYAREVPSLAQYAQGELARALRSQGRSEEAFALTSTVLDGLRERVATLPASYAMSLLSAPSVDDLFAEHVAAALDLDSPRDLRDALEASRGMVFLAEVRRRRLQGSRRREDVQFSAVATLAPEVARAAHDLWEARASGRLSTVQEARRVLWERRLRLRAAEERERLAQPDEGTRGPEIARDPQRFRTPPALRAGEAMLYYARAGAEYVAALAWQDRVHPVRLGPAAALEQSVHALRVSWIDPDEQAPAAALDALVDAVVPETLRRHLLPPAGGGAAPAHVYVAASGGLASLPWPALIAAASERAGRTTREAPTVSLIASQAVLAHVRTWNPAEAGGPLLALGDPDYTAGGPRRTRMAFFSRPLTRLDSTAEETRALVDAERGDVLLLGADANEALLRRCLFDAPYPFDVLHLACHGFLYGATPWLSSLALHALPDDDGLVTVDEVGAWRFQGGPRLVVLAACESGLGAPVPGEGEEGLVRAFLLAGSRHVVASFWKVPDVASRDLMIAFHRHRREDGLSPVLALRRAQDEARGAGSGGSPPPVGWAGWAVWGPRD